MYKKIYTSSSCTKKEAIISLGSDFSKATLILSTLISSIIPYPNFWWKTLEPIRKLLGILETNGSPISFSGSFFWIFDDILFQPGEL